MYEALSIAATALRHQQVRIDTIANNVANVNTIAYKSARLDFKDALYTRGLIPGLPRSPEENNQKGHGLLIAGIARDFRGGNLQTTERPLDFAIQGEGFFTLRGADGGVVFARNGSFGLSAEADGTYLVNGQGLYVLDVNGDRIQIPAGVTTIGVNTDGTLWFRENDEIVLGARLNIVTFRNITGLESVGDSLYAYTEAAGEVLPANDAIIRQGVLEGSNVSLSEEMTRLIRTQRAFQLASRALTTADEMEGIANNMKR